MSEHIAITSAQPTDLPAILDLLARSGLPQEGLSDRLATTLVARSNGSIMGSVAIEVYGASALLRSVAVDATLRGHGLGQRLTEAALDLARTRGITHVYLLTETAADFFPRFGFKAIDRAQVKEEVKQSIEFKSACPDSALAMMFEMPNKERLYE